MLQLEKNYKSAMRSVMHCYLLSYSRQSSRFAPFTGCQNKLAVITCWTETQFIPVISESLLSTAHNLKCISNEQAVFVVALGSEIIVKMEGENHCRIYYVHPLTDAWFLVLKVQKSAPSWKAAFLCNENRRHRYYSLKFYFISTKRVTTTLSWSHHKWNQKERENF